jgi:hypothetical protein
MISNLILRVRLLFLPIVLLISDRIGPFSIQVHNELQKTKPEPGKVGPNPDEPKRRRGRPKKPQQLHQREVYEVVRPNQDADSSSASESSVLTCLSKVF